MKKITLLAAACIAVSTFTCKKDEDKSPDCQVCSRAYETSDVKATVAARHVGVFSGLSLQYTIAASPFPNGTKADFELTANNELVVKMEGQGCVTLNNPTFYNATTTSEYSFRDNCVTKLKYSISFKTDGTLNEVNVGSITDNTFYGQFR